MDESAMTNLYNKLCEAFLINIDNQDKAKVSEAYIEYLHNSYDSLFKSNAEKSFDNVAYVCVKKEKTIHFNLDAAAKKAFLFPDKEFVILQELSFEIAGIARSKKLGKEYRIDKTKEEYIRMLNDHADKVTESFKYSAERLLSESLMDIEYIFDDSNGQSFRTAII